MGGNEEDQCEKGFEEVFAECSVEPDSSDSLGEPEVHPRIGDEYQVAIPDMLSSSELEKYLGNPCDSQTVVDASHKFLIGLPVPITWVHNDAKSAKDERKSQVHYTVDSSRVETKTCIAECSSDSEKRELSVRGDSLNQMYVVPGLPEVSWSEFEVDCFLVALYFFGKNLLQVEGFMESKETGQILFFYYGRFCRSVKYQRWAGCRKMKRRKCIIGQRLLTGGSQQELFSRILPHMSEESKNASAEAYKAFADGNILLEEYVSKLKSMVGLRVLVEAVIGRGKKDLIALAMKSSRTNQTLPSHPETLPGKACSSLTYEELIKLLTGDFRLSKARSNDLFWEAVWPRLLAKGWHSEKPKGEAYRFSSNSLVFLMPGINKFKRKLLKGDHYFDSVSDVLKRVASEPELLVLETEENGHGTVPNSSEDDRKCYLKPRSLNEEANHMKFTIVDTSLAHEDEVSKVRELRDLPLEMKSSSEWLMKKKVKKETLKDLIVYSHSKEQANHGFKRPKKRSTENQLAYVNPECADPVPKRRKLSACSVVRENNCILSLPAPIKKKPRVTPPSSSVVASLEAHSSESNARSRPMIDLNAPPAPTEHDTNEEVTKVKENPEKNCFIENHSNGRESSDPVGGSIVDGICSDEQANANARRHSRRNRPMSTKALEALEAAFLDPKAAKKRTLDGVKDDKPKVCRRPRTKISMPGNCTVDAVANSEGKRSDGVHGAVGDVVSHAMALEQM